MQFEIHTTIEEVAQSVADRVEDAVAAHEAVDLGLAGGSTPRIIHALLAGRPVDWSRVTAWKTDERWVGPDHPESNQRMARETLVDDTGVRFLAPDTTVADPTLAATAFEQTLADAGVGGRHHSIIMLGLGSDGHTASLFPGTAALDETDRMYVENWVPELDTWRLTATYPLIRTADLVAFVVTGASKADVMRRIAAGERFPATQVDARGDVVWFLDAEAAALL